MHRNTLITILAILLNRLTGSPDVENACSATSAYVIKGLLVRTPKVCAQLTSICIHETQKILKNTSPMDPTTIPEFLIASGIARIPVPMFPFSRCMIVSQFLMKKDRKFEVNQGCCNGFINYFNKQILLF